jgi:RNA polymerase sigma-70 factor (ECF subfamily)
MHEEAELVKQIIEHLPELQRNTIRMKDIEGYENDEIAEIIGCSSESVRSNLSRARKQVRTVYLQIVRERKRVC